MIPILHDGLTPRARAHRFGQVVATEYEISLADICGSSSMRYLQEPRYVLCWLLRASGLKWSELARWLGLNRVALRAGTQKLERRLMTDDALDKRVTELVHWLNAETQAGQAEAGAVAALRAARHADAEEYAELL